MHNGQRMTTKPFKTSLPPATGTAEDGRHQHTCCHSHRGSVPSLFLFIFQIFYEPYFKKVLFFKKKKKKAKLQLRNLEKPYPFIHSFLIHSLPMWV